MFAKSSRYVLRGSLAGHYGGIECLAVTEDGKVLASGGSDGVRLWNVASLSRLNRPNGAGNRGTVSALTWIRREEDPGEVLVYGTQCGFVCVWKQRSPTSVSFNLGDWGRAEMWTTGLRRRTHTPDD
ncbi:hypothetical protein C8R44DRAFT_735845 [Mycena epipterygia]|nr:hypothetical protein C8R44DRAFT_735845 [Mycena epipterygia]